ncbi:MAG: chitobiase/beta-hexosaminidase C-terminal domain-containing protein [Chloroflexi bacterium]|nr:chitobiase/beta-hexosaminidase C-terminal domain-containing protein [Chloroflexota bacterium]
MSAALTGFIRAFARRWPGGPMPLSAIAAYAIALAYGGGLWLHLLHDLAGAVEQSAPHGALHWLRDATLALPLIFLGVWLALWVTGRLLERDGRGLWRLLSSAAATASIALCTSTLLAVASPIHDALFGASHAGHELLSPSHMVQNGLLALVANLPLAGLVSLVLQRRERGFWFLVPGSWLGRQQPGTRNQEPETIKWHPIRGFVNVVTAAMLVASLVPVRALTPDGPAQPAPAAVVPAPCTAATVNRSYEVEAISVDVPFNRWGDHNPNGQIYVLSGDKAAVQNWWVPLGDPASPGSRRVRPRPLVLRANEGECVEVMFKNELSATPGEELAQNPRASIHVHGPSYDAQSSDGSRVGWNADTTVGIGEHILYYWRAPSKEGLYFFHDHGNLAGSEADGGSNAHGLYGALVVEPAGSEWYDPVSGNELYTGTGSQSGDLYIEAIIVPPAAQGKAHNGSIPDLHGPNEVAFRESIQISQDEIPSVGLGFNFGVEPLLQRQAPLNRCPDCVGEETWLSSWPHGDPGLVKLASGKGPWYPTWHPLYPGNNGQPNVSRVADPEDCGIPTGCYAANVTHAYTFDAIKIRFAHAGPKETHVFHLHAHQWLSDPFDVGSSGNTPGQPGAPPSDPANVNARRPQATTIDSQTMGPGEAFTADLLFGAGSKPGTVGDSIFHCHLYPHFAEGFWALLRVHDVREDGTGRTPDGIKVRALVSLPDRAAAADVAPLPDEFNPGYPRFIPGQFGWRAPQPLNGVSESNGSADVPNTVAREDLRPATRIVAGKGLAPDILEKTQSIWNDSAPRNEVQAIATDATPVNEVQVVSNDSAPRNEVQVVSTDSAPRNEVQTVSTSAGPVREVQAVSTTSAPRNEVQTISTTSAPRNEVQSVATDATDGSFTLTFDGQPTGAIAYNALAAAVEAALEALPNIADVVVTGTGTTADPWLVTFVDPGGANVAQMVADGAGLTGGTVTVTTTTEGADGGTFVLAFEGQPTGAIAYNTPAATIEAALEALPNVVDVAVTGTGTVADPWVVTFVDPGNADVAQTVADGTGLTSGAVGIATATEGGNGGSFTLTFEGQPSGAIAYNASAAAVEATLEALPNVADVAVTGTGTTPDPWLVTFVDPGGANVAQMTANGAGLTSGTVAVTTTKEGANGGTFTLTFDGQPTGAIAYNAPAATIEAALESLPNVADVAVTGSGTAADPWFVTFADPGGTDVAQMTADGAGLAGGSVSITTATEGANGGTFTLTFDGQPTGAIAYNAPAATIEAALEAFANVADVAVTGSGTATDPWVVTFADPGGADVVQMVADGTGLTSGTIAIATTVQGGNGGTFTLSFEGQPTGAIAYNAPAAAVEAALEALPNVADVAVTGAGTTADPWLVTFDDPGGADVAQLVANGAGLTSGTATVATTTEGRDGGSFVLTFEGQPTGAIAYNAPAATIEAALEALPNVADVAVAGTGTSADPWTVTFLNPGGADVAQMTADGTKLTNGTVAVTTTTEGADGGTFRLRFETDRYGIETTEPIAYNASAAAVQAELNKLNGVVHATVTGAGRAGDPWVVKLGLWSRAASLLFTAADTLTSGATTISPDLALVRPGAAEIAYQLAVERNVSLLRYNPGYDPANPPAQLKLPKPGGPLVDPCRPGSREVTYNVSIIQLDIVYNEAGWHDNQGRILVLDQDVDAVLAGQPPEPLFFRVNAGDCVNFNLTNRLPNWVGNDDYLRLIQTNMVGQHIHLVKFDVTASDGASNGWNNQQAAFSQEQREFDERVLAGTQSCDPDSFNGDQPVGGGCRVPAPPSFDPAWSCSSAATCPRGQTLHERWYADYELRTVFSHDHHFPAEDQNRGYFSALVVEPKGMDIRNSFTGEYLQPINDPAHGTVCESASEVPNACVGTAVGTHRDVVGPGSSDDFREYSLAIQDFVSNYRPCLPGEVDCISAIPGQKPNGAPGEPEEYPDDDPGVFGVNYRNAPLVLRGERDGVPVDPAYRFSSWVFGDPMTPLLQAYAGDGVRVRLIQGAQEEQHVLQIHGMRWRDEPDDPGSPLVNARALGISDAFNFEIPRMECSAEEDDCLGDYLYSTTSTDDLWLGVWGILRVSGKARSGLLALPDNALPVANGGGSSINWSANGKPPQKASKPGNPCPSGSPLRQYHVVALEREIAYNEYGYNDPYALMYALVEDGEAPQQAAARAAADPNPEPLVIRANEGDCIEVTLTNLIDPGGRFATEHGLFGAHDTDSRGGDPPLVVEPLTGVPAGLRVSLHPALLLYDVRGSDGATVGYNRDQTVGPGESTLYRWYADDVAPGELGAINLTDYGDVRGHRHHGLFAALNVEPKNATYHHPLTGKPIRSGVQADIRVPGQPDYREFTLFFQDGLNLRDRDGYPLVDAFDHPPTPEEPIAGMPDAEDRGEKGFNYRNASFAGRLGRQSGDALDGIENGADLAYVFSSYVHSEPYTPIFRAYSGDPVRLRVLQGGDKPRQHTFQVSGHAWPRQPFDEPGETELIGTSGGFSVGRALNIHFDAGGSTGSYGDYKYNCGVFFHHQSGGLWGIMRVYPRPEPAPVSYPDDLKKGTTADTGDNPHTADYHPLMLLEQVQIEAQVFDDRNMDGTRSNGESGVEEVEVQLLAADGTAVLDTRSTEPGGKARFLVAPGAYDLKLVLPEDATKPSGSDWAATTPTTYRADATSQFERPEVKFGMVRLGDLTVQVFADRDGDDVLEPEDSGLSGWPVAISGGGQRWSGATAADGTARFDGLKPGSYTVEVVPEPGRKPTRQVPFTVGLAEDESRHEYAGYTLDAGFSVKLFNDSNNNGIQDAGESRLAGWNVTMSGGPPNLPPEEKTVTTDLNGIADFGQLTAGSYTLTQALKPDWFFSSATATTNGTTQTPNFTCTVASCTTVLIEQTTQAATIGNRNPKVWIVVEPFNDTNNDGLRQSNEKKLVGWSAELWVPGGAAPIAAATTGNNGLAVFYHDPGTPPDTVNTFTVKLRQPLDADLDWRPTRATETTAPARGDTPAVSAVSVIAGETAVARVGFIQLGTIGVMAFHDQDRDGENDDHEVPLANRTVRLFDRTGKTLLGQKATNAGGLASFQVKANTEYKLEVLLPTGWVATTPLASNGKPTTNARVTSAADPTLSVDPVEFGQYALNDVTPPPPPKANPEGGTFVSPQSVTLTSEAGATVRYTLDGTNPTATSGMVYGDPISIASSRTLKALAVDAAGNVSAVTTETYTIEQAGTQTAAPAAPKEWKVLKGSTYGSLGDLTADDGQYFYLRSGKVGGKQVVDGYGSYTVPAEQRNLVGLTVVYDGGASAGGFDRTLSLYNFATSSWETLNTTSQTSADAKTTVDVSGDPTRFLSSNGELRLRVQAANRNTFDLKADLMMFTVTYQP